MSEFYVDRLFRHWAVFQDGEPVTGGRTYAGAHEARDRLERESRRKERKCLCCSTKFMSEGPHNRMCGLCRSQGASAESVAV